ncbi:type II secretion system protein [Helicobacter zhangjianzhongii]|nr:type II secretion system protein [Helicobacter sp. CPD2-1]MDL0079558.1 type II secretion system GspH family protein [Helicobacter sp. CPD2-1]
MRLSRAFSMIELVFVIAVLGVLSATLIKQLDFSKKACYTKLAHTLGTIQEQLSFLYTRHSLLGSKPTQSQVRALIEAHTLESKQCRLGFVRNRFRAEVAGVGVNFTLEPSDLSIQPSFKCPFSRNIVCREILLRNKRL